MDDANESNATEGTRPLKGGEAPTTRFGMEDGDNTDVPATGPDQQGGASSEPDPDQAQAEEEAAKLGDFA